MAVTHTTYLLLGSNLGNREALLEQAVQELAGLGKIAALSAVKETEPWGFEEKVPSFLNQAVRLETTLGPEELLQKCLEIEKKLVRQRPENNAQGKSGSNADSKRGTKAYSSRLIDIDILLFNQLKHKSKQLTIPHPRLRERPFAIALLQEILPKNISLQDFY